MWRLRFVPASVLLIALLCATLPWMLVSRAAAASAASPVSPGSSSAKPASRSAKVKRKRHAKVKQARAAMRLPELVVTATRIPQPLSQIGTSVTIVPAATIREQKIRTVGDALRQVPGVEITQTGSPGSVTGAQIRGSTSPQTLILIDGVPVNTASSGGFDLADVTTGGLSRIEVLRGAGGSLYGSQAIGGVINILSREGRGKPKFTMLSEGGNRATEQQALTASGAQGKLSYAGSLSYFSTDGFRPINDNSDNLAGAARLDYHATENTTLRGFARYWRSNVSLPTYSIAEGVLDPNAHQRDEFMLYKGEIDHRFTDQLSASASGWFVRDEVRLNAYPFPASPSSETDDIADESRGANLQTVYAWTPTIRTVSGFDFADLWARSGDNYASSGFSSLTLLHHDRQQYAGYVEQEASFLNGHILATGGMRVDGNSDFGKEVSPAWSVAIPLARWGLTLRGSYSEGFRAPSYDELFFPNFGNPNLAPELSSEYDGGFTKRLGEAGTLGVTYFSRRVHNLIVSVPCSGCLYGVEAGNAGRVDVQGVEIEPATTPWHGFGLSGNFTYIDETHRGATPLRVPKYSASALLRYAGVPFFAPSGNLTGDLVYLFVGDRDDISPVGAIVNNPAYHRFDLVLTYTIHRRWRRVYKEQIFTRIENLFDRNYAQALGFKSPPINFVAGVKFGF